MALQFDCPYCTAPIRVPDSAGGKKGTCPKCGEKLLVPRVAPPPVAVEKPEPPAASPDDLETVPEFQAVGDTTVPGLPGGTPQSAPTPEGEFSFGSVTHPEPPTAPASMARTLRRRKKQRGSRLLVPLLFGSVLLTAGGSVWYLQTREKPLIGEMAAVPLDLNSAAVTPKHVDPALGGVAKEVQDDVLTAMSEDPLQLKSSLLEVEFRGNPLGLQVMVYEGPSTMMYRVDPSAHPELREHVAQRGAELDAPRQRELEAAAAEFFAAMEQAERMGEPLENPGRFRDPLGLNALVGTLGYHTMAVVGRAAYRCVYEDADGRLYFALPPGTQQFELRGRPLDDGLPRLTCQYTVRVVEPPPMAEPQPEKTPEPEESESPSSEPSMPATAVEMPAVE